MGINKMKPLTDEEGEVRDITAEDFKGFRPTSAVHPDLIPRSKKRGAPRKDVTKEQVTLRLDPDVIADYRASGYGWSRRLNADLRKARGL